MEESMKRSFTIAAVLIAALAAVPALMLGQESKAEQEVLELHRANDQALLKADIATLDKNMADDITVVEGNGVITSKADLLEHLKSGKMKFESIEESDAKIHVYGNTAVITSTSKVTAEVFGRHLSGQARNTYILLKRDGKWVAVLHQMTPIAPPKSEMTAKAPPSYVAAPAVYKLIGENDQFRVIKGKWAPGQRDAWHSHLPLTAYALTDCSTRMYTPDGKTTEIQMKAGSAGLLPVIPSHSAENIGTTACEILIVERK
jgi:ketosteroid isomerase-like protein